MMSPEHERWAEASAVLRWKGDHAQAFVAERVAALGSVGDSAGVERWRQIAYRMHELLWAKRA